MPIVLRECAYTHDAVQTARRFIAVALAKFTHAQRQFTVAFNALLEDQNVPWAVHRLEREVVLFALGREHVVTLLVPVAGFFPERTIQNLRAFYL